jgi:hypothetical protein
MNARRAETRLQLAQVEAPRPPRASSSELEPSKEVDSHTEGSEPDAAASIVANRKGRQALGGSNPSPSASLRRQGWESDIR